jgi:hypothetical protein
LTRTRPAVIRGELLVGLVIEVFGQVLGRGVQHREGLQVVEHPVVDAVDHRAQHLLEQLEVQQQAGFVQFGPGQRDADLVVVPVRVLALALVIAKVVSGGETCLHGDFIHRRLLWDEQFSEHWKTANSPSREAGLTCQLLSLFWRKDGEDSELAWTWS